MKVIYDIAVAELKKLFYSPVAWLILIIFAYMMGLYFTTGFKVLILQKTADYRMEDLTNFMYASGFTGIYNSVPGILYMFIPLLTMNIISRDKGSGAIKLMLSSPLSNRQIIFGKYLGLVIFSLIMVSLVFLMAMFGFFTIENVDTPLLLCGMLGIFLLACAYSAIGLFMSSITTYPIVAAIGTLVVLMVLQFAGNMWQDIAFIRDITYWLSLRGRVGTFIAGMITSEDLLYYLAVIGFFLAITLIKLKISRSKRSRMQVAGMYGTAILSLVIVAYFTSMPAFKMYWDLTRTQSNTLSRESQKVMSKMDGGLKVHTYTNMLDAQTSGSAVPAEFKRDVDRFEQYTRFKPEIKLDYTYYYKLIPGWYTEKYPGLTEVQIMDTIRDLNDINFDIVPYNTIADKADLSDEKFRFVRTIERDNGRKTFLRIFNDPKRFPEEEQITAAFKRLVDTLPKVGFVSGHGERSTFVENERGYSMFAQERTFRYSLINSGFDFESVVLTAPVPEHISILVVADVRKPFSEMEMQHFNQYIAKGGNLVICGEPGMQNLMNTITASLGVRFLPGTIVQPKPNTLPEILSSAPTNDSTLTSPWMAALKANKMCLVMNGACGLETSDSAGFHVRELFMSDTTPCWAELETTDLVNDSLICNAAAGEEKRSFVPAVSLTRKMNNNEQKIIVTGDADWLSNGELNTRRRNLRSGNFAFICSAFYWLSDGIAPINTERDRPIDNNITVTRAGWKIPEFFFKWGIPLFLLAAGVLIWVRRRGR
jgi:ABC-2 type transport system permease protein